MAVKVGNASISENGTIRGSAGDQNGREVYIRNWYLRKEEWYTLIPTDPNMLEYIALAMERACKNDDIGYDQNENRTLWNNVRDKGYDPAKTTKKVETDCAELAALCAQYALVMTGKTGVVVADSYTANLADNLVKTGYFKKLTADKYTNKDDYLLRGMIQVTRKKGHAWVVLSNGEKASLKEFYAEEPKPVEPQPEAPAVPDYNTFTIADGTWNVRSGPGTKYDSVGRVKGGMKVEGVDTDGWVPIKFEEKVRWIGPSAVKR